MIAPLILFLSMSNIISPLNNSVYFPGNSFNVNWDNINSSDYLNIQMYINQNNTWKTYIKNHHLFSITTDSDNCCGYNVFLPHYFSELWDSDLKLEIKNIGVENPKTHSIYFSVHGINVKADDSYVNWYSNYLTDYKGFLYDSTTTLYNYKDKFYEKKVANWTNTHSGNASWNSENLNNGYKVLVVSNDSKLVGLSDPIFYTTTYTSSTKTDTITTTTDTSTTTTDTSTTTTDTSTTTTATNTSTSKTATNTTMETNTTTETTTTTTSTITPPWRAPIIDDNKTVIPKNKEITEEKKFDWFTLIYIFSGFIIFLIMIFIIISCSNSKDKRIHPELRNDKASQTIVYNRENMYDRLRREKTLRLANNGIYDGFISHDNPMYVDTETF